MQTLQITAKSELMTAKETEYISYYFTNLLASYDFTGIEITVKEERIISESEILIQAICDTLGVEWYKVLMGGRKIGAVYARIIFTHKMLNAQHSLIDISKILRRDRSSIHHYKMKFMAEYKYNCVFRNYVIQINQILSEQ